MAIERLKAALISLQEGISGANPEQIKSSLSEIDLIKVEEKKSLDAQLRHYLKNRSYQKALMYIGGEEDIPVGRCGGKH